MQLRKTSLFLYCWISISVIIHAQNAALQNNNDYYLTTQKTIFKAGSKITLDFSTTKATKPLLYCSSNYGSTLVYSTLKNNTLSFQIPTYISNKAGVLNWSLLTERAPISGQLKIIPKTSVASMETYLGPPSIEAGGKDYTMLVVIPTDDLDNPLKKETPVQVKYQFLSNEVTEEIKTNKLIAYKNIYSRNKPGRMLISSESIGKNSKEFDVNITPAIPTNFTILTTRNHDYADGNQITTFSTSIIKDTLGNIVSDGTYVYFFIRNKKQAILKTSGTTIQGIATAKMIHPDHAEEWNIKAYIEGMAESNTIMVKYKQVITDFNIVFSNNNRSITVGPLTSFMNQMIPDGLQVNLNIFKNNKKINTIAKTSRNGFVQFKLKQGIFKKGSYQFEIETAGMVKKLQTKRLW